MPERVDFWGITAPWAPAAIYTFLGLASLIFVIRFVLVASKWWRIGRPLPRWDCPLVRFGRVLRYYLAQSKVLSQLSGLMHVFTFWSMLVFFLGTVLATIHSHFFKFLIGNDVFCFISWCWTYPSRFFLVGIGMAASSPLHSKTTNG